MENKNPNPRIVSGIADFIVKTIALIICYLFLSFVLWEINIMYWTNTARIVIALVFIGLIFWKIDDDA